MSDIQTKMRISNPIIFIKASENDKSGLTDDENNQNRQKGKQTVAQHEQKGNQNMKVKKIISGIIAGAIMLSVLTASAFAATYSKSTNFSGTVYTFKASNIMSYTGGALKIDFKTEMTYPTDTYYKADVICVACGLSKSDGTVIEEIGDPERVVNSRLASTTRYLSTTVYPSVTSYGIHSAYKSGQEIFYKYLEEYNWQ